MADGAGEYDVVEASIGRLMDDMAAGRTTSAALVGAYQARIAAIDWAGPALRSVICLSPTAPAEARRLDAERAQGSLRGALHGVPILVKDNIDVADGTATTAGSLALKDNVTGRDAPLVARLKASGAVILGKTNLSEWANIRTGSSVSGWSGVGGLTKNPYVLDRSAGGSSSGTGAAIAASLAAAGVGTETDGSITCPASFAGLVGFKPTLGLVSRTHVVPISHNQDTAGPMARSVLDAAILLTAMAGSDPADAATAEADAHAVDFAAALGAASLAGKRLGILPQPTRPRPSLRAVFDAALALLRGAGATIVEIDGYEIPTTRAEAETAVLMTDLKVDLNAYLATAAPAVTTRTLADLIASNASTPREMELFGQDLFERAESTLGLDDPNYLAARAECLRLARTEGIDRFLAEHALDALIAPSYAPAPRVDIATGAAGWGWTSRLAAIAGYPHLTVPMGQVRGLPVGLSFIGAAWSDTQMLRLGHAFEQLANARRAPAFLPTLEADADVFTPAVDPRPALASTAAARR